MTVLKKETFNSACRMAQRANTRQEKESARTCLPRSPMEIFGNVNKKRRKNLFRAADQFN